uniref:Uncharacterized protein n=1 Tax=Meloidogyne enterolobii TaxID=390850 RepID=A0A6V7V3I8_MELEN|nr:unnamed protein product [Meloidogyne enterolobii]
MVYLFSLLLSDRHNKYTQIRKFKKFFKLTTKINKQSFLSYLALSLFFSALCPDKMVQPQNATKRLEEFL